VVVGALHVHGAHNDSGAVVVFNLVATLEKMPAFGTSVSLPLENGILDRARDSLSGGTLHVKIHQIAIAPKNKSAASISSPEAMMLAAMTAGSRLISPLH
jgi:cytochrome b